MMRRMVPSGMCVAPSNPRDSVGVKRRSQRGELFQSTIHNVTMEQSFQEMGRSNHRNRWRSRRQGLNTAIVGSAQAVEHCEIARYGTLIAWAERLGRDDMIRLLNTNLNEKKAADRKLSTAALRKG
jgi:ferritin-like metal-binding protein YciE